MDELGKYLRRDRIRGYGATDCIDAKVAALREDSRKECAEKDEGTDGNSYARGVP
jgi:hypothetical protein